VLAYSGGLDTSIILKWLQETSGCEVVTFTADIMHSYADFTIFEGRRIKGWPSMTISRGKVIFEGSQVSGEHGHGRYLPRKLDRLTYPIDESWDLPK